MKKALLATLPIAAFVAGMTVVPSVFAADSTDNCTPVDLDAFQKDLQADNCSTITLGGKIDLTKYETITKELTIDLGGYNITNTAGNTALYVNDGGKLTLTGNGTVQAASAANAPVFVQNGTLNVQGNAKIENTANGMAIIGQASTINISENASIINSGSDGTGISIDGEQSKLTITGGTVDANGNAITVFGNNPTVEISGGKIKSSNGFALSGNGSNDDKGTHDSTIKISGTASLTSESTAAIYNPQSGTLEVTGGTITGALGIVARQGTITVTGGTITANGQGNDYTVGDATDASGRVKLPGGVAMLVDNTENYGGGADPAKATIGGTAVINATAENPVQAFGVENNAGNTVIVNQGAKFNGTKPAAAYLGEGLVVGPNNVVMTEAEAEKMAEDLANQGTTENPNTADSIATYITIATVALLSLGATALIAKKANR